MNIKRTNKLKTNSSGFGHIEMLILVVAVVVIGGVGFFVYQNQNNKTAKAHAGGWSTIAYAAGAVNSSTGYTVQACYTPVSAFGTIIDQMKFAVTTNGYQDALNIQAYDASRNWVYSQIKPMNLASHQPWVISPIINVVPANGDHGVITLYGLGHYRFDYTFYTTPNSVYGNPQYNMVWVQTNSSQSGYTVIRSSTVSNLTTC